MTKHPLANVAASVHDRLLRRSRETKEDFQFLLQRYAAERFLYRLGRSRQRDRYVLKGAMLFALWGGAIYRPTRDLDFTGYGSSETGAVFTALREICAVPVDDDGLVFDAETLAAEPIREDAEYDGLRVRFQARLGSARIPMQIDIGFGNAIEPPAIEADYPTLLDAPAPRIRAYPHEAVIAEKLHAMVMLGERNSRYKDFYDLYVLARQFAFDGKRLARAVAATFERRRTRVDAALPAPLTPRFYADATRAGQWRAYLSRNALPGAPADWGAVGELLREFLGPPWSAIASGQSFAERWAPAGPWRAVAQDPVLRRFRPYPAYKDSGIDWLQKIPAHWQVKRLRLTITSCQNGVWGDEPDGIHDVGCVRVADFNRTTFRVGLTEPTLRSVEPKVLVARQLRPGDLLLEKSGGGENQPVGVVVLFDHDTPAVCSNFIARVTVAIGYDARFLSYLHAALYSSRINSRHIKQSTGIQNLDSSSYLAEAVGLAPKQEQRAIAGFLDRETARIDELVAKNERLIAVLQGKRAALITRAVTKGLDPTVPMKDSGVVWLGQIPAHWEVKRTKFAARLRSGHTPSRQHPEYWENCTIPWFGLADVWQIRDGRAEYVDETAEKISELGLANSAARLLPKGTVMLSRTASVGFSAIMGSDMATTQDFVNWVCGPGLRPEYLLYVFRSMQNEFHRLTMGSTHQTIYMPDVGRFSTPIPPISEQDQIVAVIRAKTHQIDALVEKVQGAIDRLKELRTALISAAVTGKIDVREETA